MSRTIISVSFNQFRGANPAFAVTYTSGSGLSAKHGSVTVRGDEAEKVAADLKSGLPFFDVIDALIESKELAP